MVQEVVCRGVIVICVVVTARGIARLATEVPADIGHEARISPTDESNVIPSL